MATNLTHRMNVLQRWKLRIKHGVMRETIAYELLRRYPPPPPPPMKRKRDLKEIKLPTDPLEEAYRAKAEEYSPISPIPPIEDPSKDPAAYFAAKQYEYMRRGWDDEAAAERVKEDMARERDSAIEQATRVAAEFSRWRAGAGPPPAMSDACLAEWTDRAAAAASSEWTDEQRLDVDAWLAVDVLGWDWRLERTFHEEAAVLETDGDDAPGVDLARAVFLLRRCAFGDAEDIEEQPEFFELGSSLPDVEEDPDFDRLQARAEAKALAAWTPEEVEELDAYIVKHFKEDKTLTVVDPIKGGAISRDLPVERLRIEIFPELCATYERSNDDRHVAKKDDLRFDDSEGKRVVAVRSISDPHKAVQTLFRHGVFPKIDIDNLIAQHDKALDQQRRGEGDGDQARGGIVFPPEIIEALRTERAPGSYARRRVQAAKRGLREKRFMQRIYSGKRGRSLGDDST